MLLLHLKPDIRTFVSADISNLILWRGRMLTSPQKQLFLQIPDQKVAKLEGLYAREFLAQSECTMHEIKP